MKVLKEVGPGRFNMVEVPDAEGVPPPATPFRAAGLGDAVTAALSAVGLTEARASAWLGRPCNCQARREKLNALGRWAARVLGGRKQDAAEHLDGLMREEP